MTAAITKTPSPLERELERRVADGYERLSVEEFGNRFLALGYELDRSGDCRSNARYTSGPHAGESYPCCTTWIREVDTGRNAFNVDARRDANYRAMQTLRGDIFAVSAGAILEV